MNWQIMTGVVIFVILFVFDNFVFQVNLVLYMIILGVSIYFIMAGQKRRE